MTLSEADKKLAEEVARILHGTRSIIPWEVTVNQDISYEQARALLPLFKRQRSPSGYEAFTDGMEAAAQICGSLAETEYDDVDSFEAATGCEAAIMRVVKEQRAEQAAIRNLSAGEG